MLQSYRKNSTIKNGAAFDIVKTSVFDAGKNNGTVLKKSQNGKKPDTAFHIMTSRCRT